ncbi:acyl dehydratase [Antricoccus suffuscus]|uniref:Acyl dehydratase n=1 Tax=Antricoccus suffuscus TaxID=1629062 RepID=A0A2T1A1Q8_9ACTN|nr:MaoC/PaaZ C-terminal domain-containing protein [Antricoccus suffuscus]PRZ42523.1 acyl dehydratase [Antricoccus suffuscus]
MTHPSDTADIFTAGDELFCSEWFEIDRDHLRQFAYSTYLTADDVDLTISNNNPLGPDLIDGFMLLSLLLHFEFKFAPRGVDGSYGFNYGLNSVRFTSPVMIGERIRVRSTVASLVPRGDDRLLTTDNVIEVEGRQKPAMVAQWLVLKCAPTEDSR